MRISRLLAVLTVLLLLAGPALGQVPSPGESPLIRALYNKGFKHCVCAAGIGGPIAVDRFDLVLGCSQERLREVSQRAHGRPDALCEQVAGGAPHRNVPPIDDEIKTWLGLPPSYDTFNDPLNHTQLGNIFTRLSRGGPGGSMAWQAIQNRRAARDAFSVHCPGTARVDEPVSCTSTAAGEVAWTAQLPERQRCAGWPRPFCIDVRPTVRGRLPPDRLFVWSSDRAGIATVYAIHGAATPETEVQIVDELPDPPEPEPDPQPQPDPEPEPEPEPDTESEACQDARRASELLDELVQHLCSP